MAARRDGGDVIYRRSKNENDIDLWDDTALIKAYDNAVSSLKVQLGDDPTPANGLPVANESGKKNKKSHKKKSRKRDGKDLWQVGNRCRAIYSADGQVYEAKIKSIDYDAETCIVIYCGYENEEEQRLTNLLRISQGNSYVGSHTSDVPSEADSGAEGRRSGHSSTTTDNITRGAGNSKGYHTQHSKSGRFRHDRNVPTGMDPRAMPPPPFASFPFNNMPSTFPPLGPTWHNPVGRMPPMPPGWNGMPSSIPHIPPPPMPDVDCMIDDKEALYSMLMSWYMSGYHTGYYQGRRQIRKSESDVASEDTTR